MSTSSINLERLASIIFSPNQEQSRQPGTGQGQTVREHLNGDYGNVARVFNISAEDWDGVSAVVAPGLERREKQLAVDLNWKYLAEKWVETASVLRRFVILLRKHNLLNVPTIKALKKAIYAGTVSEQGADFYATAVLSSNPPLSDEAKDFFFHASEEVTLSVQSYILTQVESAQQGYIDSVFEDHTIQCFVTVVGDIADELGFNETAPVAPVDQG